MDEKTPKSAFRVTQLHPPFPNLCHTPSVTAATMQRTGRAESGAEEQTADSRCLRRKQGPPLGADTGRNPRVWAFPEPRQAAWSYRRLPSLRYRRFPNLRALQPLAAPPSFTRGRFGNRRYGRFGNLRGGFVVRGICSSVGTYSQSVTSIRCFLREFSSTTDEYR